MTKEWSQRAILGHGPRKEQRMKFEVGWYFRAGQEVLYEDQSNTAVCLVVENKSNPNHIVYILRVIRVDKGSLNEGQEIERTIQSEKENDSPWGLRIA